MVKGVKSKGEKRSYKSILSCQIAHPLGRKEETEDNYTGIKSR